MNYKTEIWVSFNYGALAIAFSKTIELDFAPTFGHTLFESNDDHEITLELRETDRCNCIIQYDLGKREFLIDLRNWWKSPVSDEEIDSTLKEFTALGYERQDDTDIDRLKKLMDRYNPSRNNY